MSSPPPCSTLGATGRAETRGAGGCSPCRRVGAAPAGTDRTSRGTAARDAPTSRPCAGTAGRPQGRGEPGADGWTGKGGAGELVRWSPFAASLPFAALRVPWRRRLARSRPGGPNEPVRERSGARLSPKRPNRPETALSSAFRCSYRSGLSPPMHANGQVKGSGASSDSVRSHRGSPGGGRALQGLGPEAEKGL